MVALPRLTGHRAVIVVSASSIAAPLAGIATAPILAHALGVADRGSLAASVAPYSLVAGVATLGLPEALTFFAANRSGSMRRVFAWAFVTSVATGVLAFAAMYATLPFLSGGSPRLSTLIVIATALALPQLFLNLLRGLASGRQDWTLVALERVGGAFLRLAALAVLALAGGLTVLSAMLVTTIGPLLAGIVYLPVVLDEARRARDPAEERGLPVAVHRFGLRIWIGTVANLFLARIGQLLFLPLSSATELGLYVVAITISDVPLIVALAMRDALYGVSAESRNADDLARASRITFLIGTIGCIVIGATLPLWIDVAFGSGFGAATVTTWILLAAGIVNFPGFVAAAGLGAWGRPTLRSIGLVVGVAAIVPPFLVLVPALGAEGGAIATLISALVGSLFMVLAASKVLAVRPGRFFLVNRSDIALVVNGGLSVAHRLRPRGVEQR